MNIPFTQNAAAPIGDASSPAAEPSRTANGASDLLDDAAADADGGGDDVVATDAAAPPNNDEVSSPPTSPTNEEETSSALVVSEAAALTPVMPSTPNIGTVNDEETATSSTPSSPASPKRNVATVTAIVKEVLQKERGASFDITEGGVGDLPPPTARPPSRRAHPWKNVKSGASKIRSAMGGGGNRNANKMDRRMYLTSSTNNMYSRESSGAETSESSRPDFDELCEELGINPQTHPHLRSPYRHFDISPESMLRSPKCHYVVIVACLVGTSLIIASAVYGGLEHSKKHDQLLNPQWVKEEKAKENKDWWVKENGDGDTNGDNESNGGHTHTVSMTKEELEQLSYDLSDAYLPIWFDRSTGWKGQSYKEAMKFCKSHDNFVPCPYDVYCPGEAGRLIFDEFMEEENGESWAPILDGYNEWVQVGNGAKQCTAYSGVYKKKPDWSSSSAAENEEITRHIMCCLEHPLDDRFEPPKLPTPPDVTKEHGEGVDDPIPPPPPGASDIEEDTTGPSFLTHASTTLTKFDKGISEEYSPYWFDNNDGWEGTTWDDGKAFCNSIPDGPDGDTFHLCPIKAYCPNGGNADKPLFIQMEAFEEGLQWAPVSNTFNGWIGVGANPCMTHLEIHHESPEWGIDGSQPELKKHILCCQAESGFEGTIKEDYIKPEPGSQTPVQGLPIVQIMPTDTMASLQNSGQEEHTGAGNSSPQSTHAGEHTFVDTVTAMKMTLNPTWYSLTEGGWTGGSHDDALDFCIEKDQELCPVAAVCPHGATFPALDGAFLTSIDESMDQWAPTINRPNQWVLISTLDENGTTQCMEYYNLYGNNPPWGLDGSQPELKRHILCCKKSSSLSHPMSQHGGQGQGQNQGNDENGHVQFPNPASGGEGQDPTAQSLLEDLERPTMIGTWFKVENGWNAGSHDDAMHFCALKEINHKRMELCPYHAYCPQGPSRPPIEGHGEIGSGEHSTEQWAPTSNGDNQWVMVGMHGHNKATQCLTHGQLNGAAPSWGLDGSNKDKKQHIMCCTPPQ